MLVKIKVKYGAQVFDQASKEEVYEQKEEDFWVKSDTLPDEPADPREHASEYKKNINVYLGDILLAPLVAVGAWWNGEPGELIADMVIPESRVRIPLDASI